MADTRESYSHWGTARCRLENGRQGRADLGPQTTPASLLRSIINPAENRGRG